MASFEKRGKKWYAAINKNGYREKKAFDNKAAAQFWATEKEASLNKSGVYYDKKQSKTLAEALQKYLTKVTPHKKNAKNEKYRIEFLLRNLLFVNKPLNKLTAQDFALWRDTRLQTMQSPSVRRELVLLSHVFELARKEWGWVAVNPIANIKKPPNNKPRDRRITSLEITQILQALDYQARRPPVKKNHELAYAFLIALETAMRRGEILGLKVSDISLKDRFLTLEDTKNGDKRFIPLSSQAIDLLTVLIKQANIKKQENLFTLSGDVSNSLFRRCILKISIKDLHFLRYKTRGNYKACTKIRRFRFSKNDRTPQY